MQKEPHLVTDLSGLASCHLRQDALLLLSSPLEMTQGSSQLPGPRASTYLEGEQVFPQRTLALSTMLRLVLCAPLAPCSSLALIH